MTFAPTELKPDSKPEEFKTILNVLKGETQNEGLLAEVEEGLARHRPLLSKLVELFTYSPYPPIELFNKLLQGYGNKLEAYIIAFDKDPHSVGRNAGHFSTSSLERLITTLRKKGTTRLNVKECYELAQQVVYINSIGKNHPFTVIAPNGSIKTYKDLTQLSRATLHKLSFLLIHGLRNSNLKAKEKLKTQLKLIAVLREQHFRSTGNFSLKKLISFVSSLKPLHYTRIEKGSFEYLLALQQDKKACAYIRLGLNVKGAMIRFSDGPVEGYRKSFLEKQTKIFAQRISSVINENPYLTHTLKSLLIQQVSHAQNLTVLIGSLVDYANRDLPRSHFKEKYVLQPIIQELLWVHHHSGLEKTEEIEELKVAYFDGVIAEIMEDVERKLSWAKKENRGLSYLFERKAVITAAHQILGAILALKAALDKDSQRSALKKLYGVLNHQEKQLNNLWIFSWGHKNTRTLIQKTLHTLNNLSAFDSDVFENQEEVFSDLTQNNNKGFSKLMKKERDLEQKLSQVKDHKLLLEQALKTQTVDINRVPLEIQEQINKLSSLKKCMDEKQIPADLSDFSSEERMLFNDRTWIKTLKFPQLNAESIDQLQDDQLKNRLTLLREKIEQEMRPKSWPSYVVSWLYTPEGMKEWQQVFDELVNDIERRWALALQSHIEDKKLTLKEQLQTLYDQTVEHSESLTQEKEVLHKHIDEAEKSAIYSEWYSKFSGTFFEKEVKRCSEHHDLRAERLPLSLSPH